jgi:polar amino acid transport system substrate-binding protein
MVRPGTCLSIAIVTALLTVPVTGDAWAQQAAMERIKRSGTITVCADPDRLPYSSQKLNPAGFDIEISQEIAKELGYKLAFTWYSTHRGTKIVRQLAEAGCDFFPGFPVDGSFEENNFKVILSKPFYSSGFATLTRADAAETILQDSKAKGVGVMMGTLPDFKLFNRGYERKLFRNTAEMIDALKHKEIDAAVVPALEGGWDVKASGDTTLKVLANTEKDFVFPIAFGFAKADKDLRDLVNGAIDKIESDGRLAAIFEKYGMVKLAGTGGGETPKSKEELEKEDAGKDGEGPPSKDKKSDLGTPNVKVTDAGSWWSWIFTPAVAEEPAAKADAPAAEAPKAAEAAKPDGKAAEAIVPETGEDLGADDHGLALSPAWRVDTKTVEDFPSDDKSVDTGRKLYKQACYKCHGPNGVSGGTIPDLRKFAAKADHYEMFGIIQAGRLDRGMPAWNDYLTADEIKQIIVYVKALHKK